MTTINAVNEITDAFLAAAETALALTDAGTPGRTYVSSGRPALDCCGQLTVWAALLSNADTRVPEGGMGGAKRDRIGAVPVLTIFVQATRCAPTPKTSGGKIALPPVSELAASSVMANQDLWALWNHLDQELRDGTLAQVCKGAWRDGATAVDGQGGCVGWELVYRYPMQGGRLEP